MVQIWNLNEVSWLEKELVEIWQEAFGDSKEVIRTFLQAVRAFTKVVTCKRDDRMVSATYLLPLSYIKKDGTRMSCYYLYAAATLLEYRGQGCFAQILQFVNEHIKEPIILVPASESLVGYYKSHGFKLWLTEKKDAIAKLENMIAKPISKEDYCNFRNEVFNKPYSMLWDDNMMDYICTEHEKSGGLFAETYIEDARVLFMSIGKEKDWDILEMVSYDARFCILPTVMANQPFFEAQEGYFNLTMG